MKACVPLPKDAQLEREIAGLIISGFNEDRLNSDLETELKNGLGGVILFRNNVGSPKAVIELTESLRKAADDEDLLIAIDHEGGRVMRLAEPFTQFPPMAALGRANDIELARKVGVAVGLELAAVGINWNFSPVVDLCEPSAKGHLGDRSFGVNPESVSKIACAYIEGLQSAGVAACAKHFPGHGSVTGDSHTELPETRLSRKEMEPHLEPFRAAAKNGVASIMTAHIRVRSIDPYLPATLSPGAIQGILREDIGYSGVIITDDVQMAGVAETVGSPDASFMALRAGADAILVAHDLALAASIRNHIDLAVRHLAIEIDSIMSSVQRMCDLKKRFGSSKKSRPPLDVIGSKEHRDLSKLVTEFDRSDSR